MRGTAIQLLDLPPKSSSILLFGYRETALQLVDIYKELLWPQKLPQHRVRRRVNGPKVSL